VASDDNVPRNVEMVKISHPGPINTLVSFHFIKKQYYILFDDSADDDSDYVMSQIRTNNANISGELMKNLQDNRGTYSTPYKGKTCYLFEVMSNKQRLDSELANRYPDTSRSTWQKYIKSGFVCVNDEKVLSPKHTVIDVDKITVNLPNSPDHSSNSIPILYIDTNIIVINKPCGMLSHSKGVANDEFTVADFFKRYSTYNIQTNRPGIIHRLDRDTSGVMIGARNPETAEYLQKQFSDRKVKKVYFAIVTDHPKLSSANIELPIGRNPSAPSTFRADINGKSALTRYDVVASNDKYSLVKLLPQTGRTHQLRVHMKHLGTPILGDKVYGKQSDRLYLHAFSIEITIPEGNRQVFTAPIPDEISKYFPGGRYDSTQ